MSHQPVDALFRWGAEHLEDAGIENAKQESRWFLLYAVAAETSLTVEQLEAVFDEHAEARFREMVARRAAREPFQHIVGEMSFLSLDIKTDSRALIPRWDSECAVALALQRIGKQSLAKIADLGTGTGVLLAAILTERANISGIAVERSPEALQLAQENFSALGIQNRISCFEGSWTEWTGWGDCDLIISNPPYIRRDIIPTLEPEVRDHDPVEALDGGPDGLDAYREIITLGGAKMKSGSSLVLEIGYDQKDAVTALLEDADFTEIQHQKDLSENDRAIAAKHV